MSGPRDHRPHRPGPDDETVEVPLRPGQGAPQSSADEPWWKSVNQRTPPAPMPSPRAAPGKPQSPIPRRPSRQPPPSRNALKRSAPRRGVQLPALIVVGAIAIAVGAVGLWFGLTKLDLLTGKVLDVSQAEAGVQRILLDPVDGYSATSVTDVVCNKGKNPRVKKGGTFNCDVVVDGRKRQVLVVFTDDSGTYEVDRPR